LNIAVEHAPEEFYRAIAQAQRKREE
jgi:hypothetical protein